MTYSVTEDFLRVFGSTSTVHAGTRWKSRKHVIGCLKSLVKGGGPIFDNSIIETTPHLKVLMAMMTRFSKRKNLQDEQIQGSSTQQEENNLDIVWLGDAWICPKQLSHYSAFVRDKSKIPVYSFVWIMSEGNSDYFGYIEDMYENQQGDKMVKVRWIVHHEEIEGQIHNLCPELREVFITPSEQEISAECIDGIAAILTPSDFKKCVRVLPKDVGLECFMCHREFKNNEVNPFSLSRLRGYSTQLILCTLKCEVNRRSKKRGNSTLSGERAGIKISDNPVAKGGPSCQTEKNKLPGEKPNENMSAAPAEQPQSEWSPNVNDNIELLSQDSGMRGCWLRCKILRSSPKLLRVQYYDIDDVDGPGKLEEWVPASRVADPDSVGVRCGGRLTVRPWPNWDSTNLRYEVGAAADAWWCDGWWEGVVLGRNSAGGSSFQVYFPGEHKFRTVERKNMRVSKDWVDNKWVSLKPKSDILAFLSELFNPTIRTPPPVPASQPNTSLPSTNREVPSSSVSRDDKGKLPSSSNPANQKGGDELNLKKKLIIRENEDSSRKSTGGAGKDCAKGEVQCILALDAQRK
ncbi:hypothetical protein BUALT_Bualt03G0089000 [Buddleja alternifolia]|uniref:BAH domain-containing protein n=1 Tax=Buddleja alternifolia TaxID=168488 RepID=A0AAV6XSA6_9LAMI|nr:hypothetical protein BUALT_Bualt03G0089000 [Buddleja alternifolia]